MKAILIDDEKPALLQLERMIQTDGRVNVTGAYMNPREGFAHLAKDKTDIVFLDIGMPEMNGLQAGEYIQQIDPDIRIVYVTAYADYALDAFELNALDYVLKPVDPLRFAKTIARIEEDVGRRSLRPAAVVQEPAVLCLKRLTLQDAAGAGDRLKWRTQKAQELLAYLIHMRGQWVTKDAIMDQLWPEYKQDKAITHLHTSVYQIRRMLKEWGAVSAGVEYSQDSYRIILDGIATDVEQFEQGEAGEPVTTESGWQRNDRLLALYRGDYLEEHDYDWAKAVRGELSRRFVQLSLHTAAYELATGRERLAIRRLGTVQEKEPYSEECCLLFMKAYASLKDYGSLISHYESFVRVLHTDLGIEPDRETAEAYRRLVQEMA
ncbi:response regulator [Paenibacillus sp. GCM10012303]|uniref:response regulator n=1 Tax=Paenibacillus sp. GCM10012303 TaxID=3317340 RepID=UPI0036111127